MTATTTDLFRSVRKEDYANGVIVNQKAVVGVLYPSFADSQYQVRIKGAVETRTRKADLKPYLYKGEQVVDPGGGTSLFDKEGAFGHKYWFYFKLPKGTVVPDSIVIVDTGYNDTYSAEHYQIEAKTGRMSLEAFKGALDNLARNAVAKLYEAAH